MHHTIKLLLINVMKNKLLTLRNISKEYNKNNEKIKVINNISFDVYEGEILSIIGTSGCGKSTLFNIIAHLIKDYDGLINYYFNDEDIGYMFQNDALFPWLNIDKNVRLGCNIKKINNDNYINNLMKRFKLSDFQDKFPHELSGGMKQRVVRILYTHGIITYKRLITLINKEKEVYYVIR